MKIYESDAPNQLRNTDFNRSKMEYVKHIRNTDVASLSINEDRMVALAACGEICKSCDHDPQSDSLRRKMTKIIDMHNITDEDVFLSL